MMTKTEQNVLSLKKRIARIVPQIRQLFDKVAELEAENDILKADNNALQSRNDEWAWEVRGLRVELQRTKEYEKWMILNGPQTIDRSLQKKQAAVFTYRPLMSVIVPTYNSDLAHLKECFDSVINQTYDKWQLCIADDASTDPDVQRLIKEYAQKDERIVYVFRRENGHISAASNSALKLANGEFVSLLDHDDILWPNALFETVKALQHDQVIDLIYSDEDKIEEDSILHLQPVFKPDFSFYYLRSTNYINHFTTIRRSLMERVGGFREGYEGTQDWDLLLRLSREAIKVYHVPKILYSWRITPNSTASSYSTKSYVLKNQKRVLQEDIAARNEKARILPIDTLPGVWTLDSIPDGKPLVSIVIPTKDQINYLSRCVLSVLEKSTYDNYEIVIVDTGSQEDATYLFYKQLEDESRVTIVNWEKSPFNYSDACNFGAKHANGEYLIMLNNDTELITPEWIERMLGYAQKPDIGAVGVQLLYPNDSYQHVGVVVGIGSELPVANHPLQEVEVKNNDQFKEVYVKSVRESSAVTAACLMVKTAAFWQVGGFTEALRVTFNDVDLCLKLRATGLLNVYLPHVKLYHHESVSVGRVKEKNRNMHELIAAAKKMIRRWPEFLRQDPYFNPNFSKLSTNLGLDVHGENAKITKSVEAFLKK